MARKAGKRTQRTTKAKRRMLSTAAKALDANRDGRITGSDFKLMKKKKRPRGVYVGISR